MRQYIRNRTWIRSRRPDLSICKLLIASTNCLVLIINLTIVRSCGTLIHWLGKTVVWGLFITDMLGVVQWVLCFSLYLVVTLTRAIMHMNEV